VLGSAVCFSRLWALIKPNRGFVLRSYENRKGAEVCFVRETRRGNLRGIPSPKNERASGRWIPTTSLLTSCRGTAKHWLFEIAKHLGLE
jgi:hypothetical protein